MGRIERTLLDGDWQPNRPNTAARNQTVSQKSYSCFKLRLREGRECEDFLVQNGLCTKNRSEWTFLVQAGFLNQNSLRIHRYGLGCGSGAVAFPVFPPHHLRAGISHPNPSRIPARAHLYVAEHRMDVQGVHGLYQYTDVVRQNLTQNFVYLPYVALGA
jgi:hypothetical protein